MRACSVVPYSIGAEKAAAGDSDGLLSITSRVAGTKSSIPRLFVVQ
jgi:hypothetical protein